MLRILHAGDLHGVAATERYVRKLCRRVRTGGGAVLVCLLLSLLLAAGAVAVAAIRRPLGYACGKSVAFFVGSRASGGAVSAVYLSHA